MHVINPDNIKDLADFEREWASCYTSRNPLMPPTLETLRAIWGYIERGDTPGGYVAFLLQNNLFEAFGNIPKGESECIEGTVQYILVRCPIETYGSADKFGAWINKKKIEKHGKRTEYY